MEKSSLFSNMAERWPSSMVARTEIERFTGGLLSEKYIANLDSRGLGPRGRIRCGRKVAYPVDQLIEWLEADITPSMKADFLLVFAAIGFPEIGSHGPAGTGKS